jgi:hypothetical protein
MQYTCEVEIDLPRARVIEVFENPDNLSAWQPGFVSMKHISGSPGQEGAKSRLEYKMGSRVVEMVETITRRDLPDQFDLIFEAKGVWNQQRNRFVEVGPSKTKWISETEFRMAGFMKVLAFLMPGMFKKQTQKYLDHFKAFAETGRRVDG